jgi:hypothetical protein
MKQRTMASAIPPVIMPPGGLPPAMGVPQLICPAHPGSLTGWLLEATTTKMLDSISKGLDLGFSRLIYNIPNHGDTGHKEAMHIIW